MLKGTGARNKASLGDWGIMSLCMYSNCCFKAELYVLPFFCDSSTRTEHARGPRDRLVLMIHSNLPRNY